MAFVEIRGLSRSHRHGVLVVPGVRDVDVDIDRGEVVAVTGLPGSGRTSLLECVALAAAPTAGEVVIDGIPTASLDHDERSRLRCRLVGEMFGIADVLPDLDPVDTVLLAVPPDEREAHRDAALALLDEVGAGATAPPPGGLTAAQRRRVALARALVRRPALLVVDEPTHGVAGAERIELVHLLVGLARRERATLVVATADPRLVSAADRVLRLDHGRLATALRQRGALVAV